MLDRSCGHRGRSARAAPPRDQAAGLRRLFAPSEPHWLPVVLAPGQQPDNVRWLADLARACAEQGDRTFVVDAAHAQVAAAFGLRARYDLAHAFNGDCAPLEACVPAGANLRILPAARALEQEGRGPHRPRRFAAGVRALAATADCALLVLPARYGRALAGFCATGRISDAVVVAGPGPGAGCALIETMRSLLSIADIDAFRLLFQGTDPDYAGRLLSKLAASSVRHGGARASVAGSVHDASAIRRLVRLVRCRSVRTAGERAGTALESAS
jgi:hypothetical protein